MKYCIPFLPLVLLLTGCGQEPPVTAETPKAEPWSNDAELVFQQAEALKHSLEQQKLEQQRIKDQGLEGRPPSSR